MTTADCVKTLDKNKFNDDELIDIVEANEGFFKNLTDKKIKEKRWKKLKADNVEARNLLLRNKIIKILKKKEFFDTVAKVQAKYPKANITPSEVFEAVMVADQKNIVGFGNSISVVDETISAEHIGHFTHEIEEAGLFKYVEKMGKKANKKTNKDVAEELFAMDEAKTWSDLEYENKMRRNKTPYDIYKGYNPEISGNKEAYAIAKSMAKTQYELVTRANRAGAYIKMSSDYIVKQTHNAAKIDKAGIVNWKKDIKKLLDMEKTFKDMNVKEIDEFLNAVYYNIIHGKPNNISSVKKSAGQAAKLSRPRELHFTGVEEFTKYNDAYGVGSVKDTFFRSINSMSRDIALMERLGPNPDSTYAAIIKQITETEKKTFLDALKGKDLEGEQGKKARTKIDKTMEKKLLWLDHQWNEVSGKTGIPVLGWLSSTGRWVRAFHNFSKLGAAGISALADAGHTIFEGTYQGISFAKSFMTGTTAVPIDMFQMVFAKKTRKQRIQASRELGVGMSYVSASIMDRYTINDGATGVLATWQRNFFKWNGLTWLTDVFKGAAAMMSSHNLGMQRGRSWAKLDPKLKNVLQKYNILEREWDVIRSAAGKSLDDGNWYIKPTDVKRLSDDVISKYMGKTRKMFVSDKLFDDAVLMERDKLATALRSFFVDRADFSSPTPGARERAAMFMGSRPGTAQGEALRVFWQYKSFSMGIYNKILKREAAGWSENKPEVVRRMIGLLTITTLGGIFAQQAKQMVKGRTPLIFKENKTGSDYSEIVMGGFTQGGGLGIYTDLLFATNTRYGQSFMATIGGPTAGLIEDVAKIPGFGFGAADKAIHGEDISFRRLGTIGTRAVKGMVPFQNYPGAKQLMDTYIWYNINELINPGYMRRLRRRYKKDEKEFWIEQKAGLLE